MPWINGGHTALTCTNATPPPGTDPPVPGGPATVGIPVTVSNATPDYNVTVAAPGS